MLRVFLRNPVTQFCLVVILLTVFAGASRHCLRRMTRMKTIF